MELDEIAIRLGLKDRQSFIEEVADRYVSKLRAIDLGISKENRQDILNDMAALRQSGKTTIVLMLIIRDILAGKSSVLYCYNGTTRKRTLERLVEMLRFFPEIQLHLCYDNDIMIRTLNGPKLAVRLVLEDKERICARFDSIYYDVL